MNSVAHAERSRVARHEAVHASAMILLAGVPDEIRIVPLADGESGYVTGYCDEPAVKRSVAAVSHACGVLDGHGVGDGEGEGDLFELERLVPDPDKRTEVLEIAAQVMEHRQFRSVRNALWRRLTFTDAMGHDEIAKVAAAAGLRVSP